MSQKLIQIVQVVKAVQRKPSEYRTVTFFGEYDLWRFVPKFDDKLCPTCLGHAANEYFRGKYIRGLFPYLKIVDANTIDVEVHPNCRCFLIRVTDWAEYVTVTSEQYRWG